MITIKTNQFDKVCRLCTSLHSHLRCITSDSIISMIGDCAPVHVSVNDGLPQFICENCFVLLNKITTFRKKCVESEKEFNKSINEIKNETEFEATEAKLEVTDPIKKEKIENQAPNTDNLLDNEWTGEPSSPSTSSNENLSHKKVLFTLKKNVVLTEKTKELRRSRLKTQTKPIQSKRDLNIHRKEIDLKTSSSKRIWNLKTVGCENLSDSKIILKTDKNVALTEKTKGPKRSRLKTQTKSIQSKSGLNIRRKEVDLKPSLTKPIVKLVKCEVCNKQMTRCALYVHMANIHGDRKTYTCSDCPKTFLYEKSLRVHYKTVHQNEPVTKKYLCDLCGLANQSPYKLNLHYKTHSTERPYKCDQCDRDYKVESHLIFHIKDKHLNIKPFVCSYCGHAFSKKKYLNDHVRTHTGEKPFKCNSCEQAFASKSGLYIHNRTHHRFK